VPVTTSLVGAPKVPAQYLVEVSSIFVHVVAVVAGETLRGRVRAGRGGTQQPVSDRKMWRQ